MRSYITFEYQEKYKSRPNVHIGLLKFVSLMKTLQDEMIDHELEKYTFGWPVRVASS
jgi:hypothetical protein